MKKLIVIFTSYFACITLSWTAGPGIHISPSAGGGSFNGILLQGSAGTPSFGFQGDVNTGIFRGAAGTLATDHAGTIGLLIASNYIAPITAGYTLGLSGFEFGDSSFIGQMKMINNQLGGAPKVAFLYQYTDNNLPAGAYSMIQQDIGKDQTSVGLTNGIFINITGDNVWGLHSNIDPSAKNVWGLAVGVHGSTSVGCVMDLDNFTSDGFRVYVNTGGVDNAFVARFDEDPITGVTLSTSFGRAFAVMKSSSLVFNVGARGQTKIGGNPGMLARATVDIGSTTMPNIDLLYISSANNIPLFRVSPASTTLTVRTVITSQTWVQGSSLTVNQGSAGIGGGLSASTYTVNGISLVRSTYSPVGACDGMTLVYSTGSIAASTTLTIAATDAGLNGTAICAPSAGPIFFTDITTQGPGIKSTNGLPASFTIKNEDVGNTQGYWTQFWLR